MTTEADCGTAALQCVAERASAGSCTAQMLNVSSRLSGVTYEVFNRVYVLGHSKAAAAKALGLDADGFQVEHSRMLRALKSAGHFASV